ncbi:signal recognition particle-docking protein FtsY [Schaalia odontolytica]|uniref:Signal recognition particle receptor FtsY n=1 Tax=Schaalia odontolytica TaxID=1660 RepID=A0A2X0TYG1_9ACTO|nr:signal recognition particle-docking protein FtsY [Schaalia odontolytica]WMS27529.1 signal recognition particle-docking protein FtsY [Schaalia odontolytica]SPT54954.1 Cell division protein FtsY homolog [Schaalia odontolytica]
MDAFISYLQSPWAIVIALAVAVLIGVLIRVAVSSRRRSPDDVSLQPQVQAPAEPRSDAPADAPRDEADQPRAGPADAAEPTVEEAAPAPEASASSIERPEPLRGRMERLRERLASSGSLGRAILGVLSRGQLGAADWEEIEESLLIADLGLEATDTLMEALKRRVAVESVTDEARIREILREELLALVDPDMDRSMNLERPQVDGSTKPAVVLMVGVNGTGKTTTVGKLARILVAEEKSVILGAADTFRAAAADQLATWGERVGVDVVRSEREGADPASVAFEAVREGVSRDVDVVLVDTAGRLQNKSTLMDELGKIKRVMTKQAPVSEVLLVLDATTGQNGMKQAEVFAEATGVTGIVLTKLDGSAKGGIVVSVQRALGVPVKFVGLGEGADDLAPFDPRGFVDAIVGSAQG